MPQSQRDYDDCSHTRMILSAGLPVARVSCCRNSRNRHRSAPSPITAGATPYCAKGDVTRHRRLQRSDPARSQICLRLQQPRHRLRDKGDNDRAIADYSEAIRIDPKYASAYNDRGVAYAPRATTNAPSRTSPRRSGSIPNTPSPTITAASVSQQGRQRPRHRGSHRGDPARSQGRLRLQPPRPRLPAKGDNDRAIADYIEAIRLDPKDAAASTAEAWQSRKKAMLRAEMPISPKQEKYSPASGKIILPFQRQAARP